MNMLSGLPAIDFVPSRSIALNSTQVEVATNTSANFYCHLDELNMMDDSTAMVTILGVCNHAWQNFAFAVAYPCLPPTPTSAPEFDLAATIAPSSDAIHRCHRFRANLRPNERVSAC